MSSRREVGETTPVGASEHHDSNLEHLTGQAIYCDDIPEPRGCLHMALVLGPQIPSRDLCIRAPDSDQLQSLSVGDHIFFTAADIPGENNAGPVVHDEPLLPTNETSYSHQPVGVVLCKDRDDARRIAKIYRVNGEPTEPLVTTITAAAKVEQVLHEPLVLDNRFSESSFSTIPSNCAAIPSRSNYSKFRRIY